MLVRIIHEVIRLNPVKIIIVTGKHHDLIQATVHDHLHPNILSNPECSKPRIYFVQQKQALGTGDALKTTLRMYTNIENVLILNADMPLISHSLLNLFVTGFETKIMIAELENPHGYGRIVFAEDYLNLVKIKEQKDCSESETQIKWCNTGIYYIPSHILKTYIPKIENNNAQQEYYLTDIFDLMIQDNIQVDTFVVHPEFHYQIKGVNTLSELTELEQHVKKE
jgi:bifunctional N-acetylglucosamine-1-phosphate-uridyltransferase/glucosamine-1-phosphate-acetyltransferase GlmU-like protein